MKALLVLLFVCSFSTAQNDPDIHIHGPSGNDLLSKCSGITNYNEQTGRVDASAAWPLGYCMGYISGMVDSIDVLAAVTKRPGAFCAPVATTIPQLTRIIVKYGNDHPEELHLPGMSLITNALSSYFPCR